MSVTLSQTLSLLIRITSNCKRLKQKLTYWAHTQMVKEQSGFRHCWIQTLSNTISSGFFSLLSALPSTGCHHLKSMEERGSWQFQENLPWVQGGCYSSNSTSLQVQVQQQVQEPSLVAPKIYSDGMDFGHVPTPETIPMVWGKRPAS